MAKLQVGATVVVRGTVKRVDEYGDVLVLTDHNHAVWMRAETVELQAIPAPVTVRCDRCGIERPLTDITTARARCKALDISVWSDPTLAEFIVLCTELAEKGVTPQQFMEGL